MSKWPLFGFEREKILEYAESLPNLGEQLKYLQYVKQEYITKPPELDPNYGIKPKLVKVINTQIEYKTGQLNDETIDLISNGVIKGGKKQFRKNELQENLKPFITKFKLIKGVSVTSKIAQLITRQLIKDGWDAKETSVSETLRKMGYVEGKRK